MPSAGDWALHRGGALTLTGVTMAQVDGCTLTHVDGNAPGKHAGVLHIRAAAPAQAEVVVLAPLSCGSSADADEFEELERSLGGADDAGWSLGTLQSPPPAPQSGLVTAASEHGGATPNASSGTRARSSLMS